MRPISRFQFLFIVATGVVAGAALLVNSAQAQDAPSLGDAARQARLQKQQNDARANDAQAQDAQTKDARPQESQPVDSATTNAPGPNSQSKHSAGKSDQTKDATSKDAQGKDVQAKESSGKDGPSKDGPSNGAQLRKASHVITNDDMPQRPVAGVKLPASPSSQDGHAPDPAFGGKMSADDVKQQIQDQKSGIAALESQIKELNDSIHFAGANCVENCVQWNESQQQKQRQVEDMRSVLENAKQGLEQMQDYARKMGYGSSVYDPEQ